MAPRADRRLPEFHPPRPHRTVHAAHPPLRSRADARATASRGSGRGASPNPSRLGEGRFGERLRGAARQHDPRSGANARVARGERLMPSFVRVLLAALVTLGLATAAVAAAPDRAEGLWIYRTSYPTGLAGRLDIRHRANAWSGTIAGRSVRAQARELEIVLTFPSEGGTFRGSLSNGALSGFWVRRPVTEDPLFPFGESLGYTGPLVIHAVGPEHWVAQVRPLEDTFTLHLKIYRDAAGQLKAAFRNPELNSFGPAMLLAATAEGNRLRFTPDKGDAIDAQWLTRPERISIVWPDMKRRIALRRATATEAARFYPAGEKAAAYAYRAPQNLGDGWQVARAGTLGMDEAQLARAVQRVIDRDPAADRAWLIHSMAVAYKGKLVLDEYFYGHDAAMAHDLRSASKTFSSVILGALMLQGSSLSPAAKIYDVLAPRGPFANPDPRKAQITL